ncbi:mitochondrial antiviral-signaling protein [Ctenopharyngodon idella]|uniref:mitochondrial antiviral-signaling protein n=1 Tax=Ctenopharyngodon idella TaxID=7959 RepID=UPI00222EEE97|nr:mitochondrial antiviral-signaling protein [Ctenopharyngodon idella]XP_051772344.1 mitochondrial antiviral-signaling protein [Ctenopharyngodon idella]
MSLTREQFYNKAIRSNLARFSSTVKVRDILPHLPCLTITDREEVEAKRETSGNFTAMQTLLDNLRRRENWPDEFITALRNCEHRELADEMSDAYDRIRGIKNNAAPAAPVPRPAPTPAPSFSSAGATASVTTATVHTVPVTTSPLLNPPARDVPAHSTPPSNNAAPEPSPAPVPKVPETQQVQNLPTPVPAPSLEPVSQAEIAPVVVAPSQAPPSAVISVSKVPTHTGPAENKTPILDTPDGLALTDQSTTSSLSGETVLSTSSAQASSSSTSPIQITKPCTTSQSSQMSENIQVPITVKDTDTSEKLPVQDTNPPLREERTIQEPEEISDPTANELVQRNNTVVLPAFNGQTNSTSTGQATSSAPTEVVAHPPSSIEQEYFSKPGILQYSEPQQNRAEALPVLPEEPCSVVSDDLEISRATESSTEPGRSTSLAEQTSTAIASPDSASWSLNDAPHIAAPSTPNQPEEDHYESFCPSQTMVNVIRFAEEPPAENLNGQPPSMLQRSRVISENHIGTENVVPLSDPSGNDSEASDRKKSASTNYREEESNARPATILQPELREEGYQELFRINNYQLVAAAGIALSAVFLAWKLKH